MNIEEIIADFEKRYSFLYGLAGDSRIYQGQLDFLREKLTQFKQDCEQRGREEAKT